MNSQVELILKGAIQERSELVQYLWFFDFEREAMEQYVELRKLKQRLREVQSANPRFSDSGTSGNTPSE